MAVVSKALLTDATGQAIVDALKSTDVVKDRKAELDTYATTKKTEINTYTGGKKTELDTYTSSKKTELDTYVDTTKKAQLDSYTTTKKGELDTYTTTKKNEIQDKGEATLASIPDNYSAFFSAFDALGLSVVDGKLCQTFNA